MRHPEELIREAWRRIDRLSDDVVPGAKLGSVIDLNRIICPLRYDICIRIEFIRLLRDEWTLYEEDFDLFRTRPAAKAYFVWFRDVRCATYQPKLLHNAARLEAGFMRRVRQTARLWRSMESNGFDTSRPIRLGGGRLVQEVNGKAINGTLFAGDGCHRIACLYLLGWRRLEPIHYEVAVQYCFKPFDNTATLIKSNALDLTAYLRYISKFYCDGLEVDSVDTIRQHVYVRKTELLPELESVLAYDLEMLRSHG